MMPGMGHCAGGGAGANYFDYLSYLESWVEKGQAPDSMVGAHVEIDERKLTKPWNDENADREKIIADLIKAMHDPAHITFTRPVYLYPAYAKYKGSGDPNKAENFIPVEPR
jgi:feruloyl esterase